MNYQLTVRPLVEPVTLAALKDQVGEFSDLTEMDERLLTALTSARETVEDETGLVFNTSTWLATAEGFPNCRSDLPREMELARNPVQSIASVEYRDEAGDWQTFAASNWEAALTGRLARVVLTPNSSWPTDVYAGAEAVRVSFVAGYTELALVPRKLRLAVLMLAGHYYQNPDIVKDRQHYLVARSLDSILNTERVWQV